MSGGQADAADKGAGRVAGSLRQTGTARECVAGESGRGVAHEEARWAWAAQTWTWCLSCLVLSCREGRVSRTNCGARLVWGRHGRQGHCKGIVPWGRARAVASGFRCALGRRLTAPCFTCRGLPAHLSAVGRLASGSARAGARLLD